MLKTQLLYTLSVCCKPCPPLHQLQTTEAGALTHVHTRSYKQTQVLEYTTKPLRRKKSHRPTSGPSSARCSQLPSLQVPSISLDTRALKKCATSARASTAPDNIGPRMGHTVSFSSVVHHQPELPSLPSANKTPSFTLRHQASSILHEDLLEQRPSTRSGRTSLLSDVSSLLWSLDRVTHFSCIF